MENIKDNTYNKSFNKDNLPYIKIILFSFIGIIIFFMPIRINNQYETVIYHISYLIENEASEIVDIYLVLFITLSIIKNIINIKDSNKNKFIIAGKIFSLIILISIIVGMEDLFFISDNFTLVLKDLLLELSIVLPVSSLFMPLILNYGLPEITEAYTHKIMKKIFKVSGKVFLIFLVYLLVNNVCGAFITYRLYKEGKLREKEACITILNFSVISLSLTGDLCSKLNITFIKFFIIEMIVLIICNIIISRIYPLKKKKQSYLFKSSHRNVNCKKHKFRTSLKIYYSNKSKKNIISLSMLYLNDVIYIMMDLIPTIILTFFCFDIIYNIPFVMDMFNNFTYFIISIFNIPNSQLIAKILNLSYFSNILAIKNMNDSVYYITNMIIGIFISLQCNTISFMIPFIRKTIINLSIREIIIVTLEKFFIICFIVLIAYNLYIGYII